jgi:hypothetical protein
MAALVVDGGDLVVRLSPLEKICTFRGNVRVPLTAVRSAGMDPDAWRALISLRRARISPGAGIPGVLHLGTSGFGSSRTFAAVYGKRPAVRVDLDSTSHYAQLLVTVPDPEAAAANIMAAAR